jgi:hypothetical protein
LAWKKRRLIATAASAPIAIGGIKVASVADGTWEIVTGGTAVHV